MNALRGGPFRLYFVAFFVSNVGTWVHSFAQTWLMHTLTHGNAAYLGALGFAFALPMILIAPFGGVIADRFPRISVLLVTQCLSALIVTALACGTRVGLSDDGRAGALQPWHLLVSQFALALLLAVDNPTRQSLVVNLVPKAALPSALAFNAAIFTGAALLGPMLGGLLLPHLGVHGLFFLNAASYSLPVLALCLLRTQKESVPGPGRTDLFGGIEHVRAQKDLRALVTLGVVFAVFGRSYVQLLPIFAARLGAAAGGYATLLTAGGVGAMLGAGGLAVRSGGKRDETTIARSIVLGGMCLVAFAWSPNLWLATGALLATATCAVVATTCTATVIQQRVPPELRGRVISLHVVTVIGLPLLGSLLLALLTRALSPRLAVTGFAGVSVLYALYWGRRLSGFPSPRKLNRRAQR
jgi:MFS family permease